MKIFGITRQVTCVNRKGLSDVASFSYLAPFEEKCQNTMAKNIKDLANAYNVLFTEPSRVQRMYDHPKHGWLSKWQMTLKGEQSNIDSFISDATKIVIT